jgi:hypothetical protein
MENQIILKVKTSSNTNELEQLYENYKKAREQLLDFIVKTEFTIEENPLLSESQIHEHKD